MKGSHRVALIYAVSVAAAGGVAYYRGKRGMDLAIETTLYGAVGGTTANIIALIAARTATPKPAVAKKNFFGKLAGVAAASNVGVMSRKGVELLSKIDTDKLYASMNSDGVKVAPVPDNPSIIVQDA